MKKTHPVKKPTPAKVAQTVAKHIKRQSHKIQDYPKPIRVATVKALKNAEYSTRRISEVLGMSASTVKNYLDSSIDNKWLQYSDAVSKILTERRDTLKILATNAIEDKLKDTDKIPLFQLSGLYKVLHDVDRVVTHSAAPTLVQTINVHPSLTRKPIAQDAEIVE